MSFSDLANFMSEALGKKVEYKHQTYEQFGEDLRKAGAGETTVRTKVFNALQIRCDNLSIRC